MKVLPFLLSIVCLSLAPREGLARTFYVDATLGRDANTGTAPGVGDNTLGPWKTVARVNAQALAPGDTVLFKRGELWRELLTFAASGSAGRPITVGAYGTGPRPILSGADPVDGWMSQDSGGRIFQGNVATETNIVYVGTARGRRRAPGEPLTDANDWRWDAGVLSVRTTSDPAGSVQAGARGAAVAILGRSYITVQDIVVERTNGSGLFVETAAGATSNIIVQRVTARESRFAGIAVKNAHRTLETTAVLIYDNTVYENGASGINVSEGVSDITIRRNISHHNNWSGDVYEAGIRVWADRRTARNLVVEHNQTYGTYFKGTGWQNGHGIWLDEVADGAIVRYNYSHDNGNVGIFIEHSHRAHVYYNRVVNNRDASIMLYRGVDRNEVYNNTISGGRTGIRLAGDGMADSVTRNVIKNNISVGATGQRLMAGDGGENDGKKGYGNVYLHNAFGPERPGFIVWGYGVIFSTYLQWEVAYGGVTQSVRTDPQFVKPGDFRLAPGSPCRGAGVAVGLERDILGTVIPEGVPPDVGAYQSSATSARATPLKTAGSALEALVDTGRARRELLPGVVPLYLLVAGLSHRGRRGGILQQP